jgi:hypothetical protein
MNSKNPAFTIANNAVADIRAREADRLFLLDTKWRKFLRSADLFRHAPFTELVFGSGSLATGMVTETSDFDVLVSVREGRMFTARYFLLALATLYGVRRRRDDPHAEPDRLCVNHLITKASWSKPPHNPYRTELYRNLILVWGSRARAAEFFRANAWCGRDPSATNDLRWRGDRPSWFRKTFESAFGGRLGDWIERRLTRPFAIKRLKEYAARRESQNGRVVISDAELEFHFDLPYEREVLHS